ncbi:MAG: EAL domain-containing protein [Marivivens sp.]|nr:EAL domain-containing protein [Marivivens sp.]
MSISDFAPLSAFDDGTPKDPLEAAMQSRDRDILNIVRQSLDHGNAKLAFQPIVAAADTTRVAFYGGLVRVHDDAGRVIPAHQFMGQIEETELGREIDCASLRLGLEVLRNNPTIRLAVNMSARSLADGKWRRTLTAGLNRGRDIGPRLILEISETSAMQLHEVLIRFMEEMQPHGVNFSLDDFGAGLIAFQRLKDFYFDMVKIDRCFIHNIQDSPDNQVMAEALIAVAQQFEMFAVAEGVETAAEAELLCDMGIDCLQGYHFGAPRLSI